jgi:septal ring factor EnvC (AmiA/AmiB activator)
MDFTDPKVWIDGWGIVRNAPHIVLPLMFAAAVAAWWFKSKTTQSLIDEKTERGGVLEERLRLWKEREEDVRQKLDESEKKRDELEKRIQELEAQIAAGAPEEELAETSAKVDTAYRDFVTANNAFVSVAKKPMPWMDDVTDRSDIPLPSRAKTTLPSE